MSDSLPPHGLQHAKLPCSSPAPGTCLNSCPSSLWCHPRNHLIFCPPFSSCPQSFPASGSFQMSQLFASGGQSIRISASASVLPVNILDWFPSGLTCWISLELLYCALYCLCIHHSSKASMLQCSASFLYSPTLTSIHDYWQNHSFGYMGLCWKSNNSAF